MPTSPAARPAVAAAPRTTRSRVSNGSSLFLETAVDRRSAEARRFKDVLLQIIADLGGADQLSEGQYQLARRCALLSVECEKIEAKSVAGEEIDLDCYGQLTDRLGRAFQRLGLERKPRPVPTPAGGYKDIDDYIARQRAKAAREAPKAAPEAGEC